MTAILALAVVAQLLLAAGIAAGLTGRLLSPASSWAPVARWWRGRLVAVMLPVPGMAGALA